MKKIKLLPIIMIFSFFLTACGNNEIVNKKIENSLKEKYNENFTVTNTYQENETKYAAVYNESFNTMRFCYDKNYRIVFDDYESYKNDAIIKKKVEKYLNDDYIIYVQSGINTANTCDIYIFTDYLLNLQDLANELYGVEEIGNKSITFHTGSIDTYENLHQFNIMLVDKIYEYGVINEDVELYINSLLNDYRITNVK